MKQNDDNNITELDKNFSRLLKLTSESDKPSGTFTESLLNDALNELKQPVVKKAEAKNILVRSNWLEKVMGWAAMIAVAFGSGLVVLISVFLKINLLLEVVVVLTMVFNWIGSLGGHV
jgi:hypothetical protein